MANVNLEADFTFKQAVANKLKTDGAGWPYLNPMNEKIYIKEAYDKSEIWIDTTSLSSGSGGGGAIELQAFHPLYDVNHIVGVSDTAAYYGWTWKTTMGDWLTPEYHIDYEIKVYHAAPGTAYSSDLPQVDNTATPYVIDYITGALTFIASVPGYLGSEILYFRGYTYTGRKGLKAVATTGSYNDLIDKPDIVIDYNNLTNKPDASSFGQWTTSNSNIYYKKGYVGIGKSNPCAVIDVSGNMNVSSVVQIGNTYEYATGIYSNPSAENYANVVNVSAYAPYMSYARGQNNAASTFSGTPGTGTPWFSTGFGAAFIANPNYIQTGTAGQYVIDTVPTGPDMYIAYINHTASTTGGSMKVYCCRHDRDTARYY